MLWISGLIAVVIWFILKFVLHKGGMVHVILMIAISLFITQFVQDRRTKEYQRSLRP
jgi:ABC-type iron transport system FetAB permease component